MSISILKGFEAMTSKNMQQFGDLDEVDHELVRLLIGNARMTNADLASAAGIAQSTCITRVRSLVSRGVIAGFSANVEPAALGLATQVLISVTLRAGARAHLSDFMTAMQNQPEVVQVFFLGGSEDFMVHLAVKDSDQVRGRLHGAPSRERLRSGSRVCARELI